MSFSSFSPTDIPSLVGKVYLVTGATSGLGLQTATHLLAHGAKVYLAARSIAKYEAALKQIRAHPSILAAKTLNCDAEVVIIDHLKLESVVKAAKEIKSKETQLHGLINNAGIMGPAFSKTSDGFESQWQTNYVAHWLLTYHLLPLLVSTANTPSVAAGSVRIVNLAAPSKVFAPPEGITFDDIHGEKGTPLSRYGMSKCGNILHAVELNQRYGPKTGNGKGIWTASLHPGVWITNLQNEASGSFIIRRMIKPIYTIINLRQPADKGSYTTLFVATSEAFGKDKNMSGSFFMPVAKLTPPDEPAGDLTLSSKLWEWTEKEMSDRGLLA